MIQRLHRVVVAVTAAVALLVVSPSAWAGLQWNDGQPATSTFSCVGQIVQGADVIAGYQADPSSLPKAGDVFYAHVGFGAAISTCDGGTQYGEVDLVLPPGVSLAVDASHPITCTYTDLNAPAVTNPTCPTNTDDHGTYGPALSPNGPATAWQLPAGRWFEIQFPLRSDRQLRGEAGGHCPLTVDEIGISTQNDCLGAVLGLAAGDAGNPWLLAHVGLVINPDPAPVPAPNPPAPAPKPPRVRLALVAHQSLSKAARARAITVTCAVSRAGRCTVTATITAGQARRLHLSVKRGAKRVTLGRGSARLRRAGHAKVRVTLSRQEAAALRRAHTVAITLSATATDSAGHRATATRRATLKITVGGRRSSRGSVGLDRAVQAV